MWQNVLPVGKPTPLYGGSSVSSVRNLREIWADVKFIVSCNDFEVMRSMETGGRWLGQDKVHRVRRWPIRKP